MRSRCQSSAQRSQETFMFTTTAGSPTHQAGRSCSAASA